MVILGSVFIRALFRKEIYLPQATPATYEFDIVFLYKTPSWPRGYKTLVHSQDSK